MVQTAVDEPCELLWPPACHFPLASLWLWACGLFYTAHRIARQKIFSHLKGPVIFLREYKYKSLGSHFDIREMLFFPQTLFSPLRLVKAARRGYIRDAWGTLRLCFTCTHFTLSKHVKTKDFISLTKDMSVSVQLQKKFNCMMNSQVTRC